MTSVWTQLYKAPNIPIWEKACQEFPTEINYTYKISGVVYVGIGRDFTDSDVTLTPVFKTIRLSLRLFCRQDATFLRTVENVDIDEVFLVSFWHQKSPEAEGKCARCTARPPARRTYNNKYKKEDEYASQPMAPSVVAKTASTAQWMIPRRLYLRRNRWQHSSNPVWLRFESTSDLSKVKPLRPRWWRKRQINFNEAKKADKS